MNAPRICKLSNGVNKTPQFLNFSTSKGGTKTIAHCQLRRGRVFEARRTYECKLRNEKKKNYSKCAASFHCANVNWLLNCLLKKKEAI
jgi:hypothetical protein